MSQTFAYQARDASGKLVKGRLDAVSEAAAVSRVRGLGLSPVKVTAAKTSGLSMDLSLGSFEKEVGLGELAVMSRQLATMISAGLSLLRTMQILADQTEHKKLSRTLGEVRAGIERGESLSAALTHHAEVFPPLMIHLVRAGEAGGFLDQALESTAETFEAEVKLRATIKAALTYPLVVLGIAILAVAAMLIFIVPVFENMFADLGGELPLPTQFLVALSRSMVWLGPLLLVLALVVWLWWRRNKYAEPVRKVVDQFKLKIPVLGDLFRKVSIARFARTFATLIGSGVPILQALSVVGETSGNWVIESTLRKVEEAVRQGRSLAAPLALEPVFPSMVTQMIAVGEDSGSLEAMLNKIADFYDTEVQSTTEQLTSLIEPVMIVFIGIVVGSMVIALYLPMFAVFDQIR